MLVPGIYRVSQLFDHAAEIVGPEAADDGDI